MAVTGKIAVIDHAREGEPSAESTPGVGPPSSPASSGQSPADSSVIGKKERFIPNLGGTAEGY